MDSLKKYEHFFGVLAVAKPELRKALLQKADDSLIRAIVEVILNTLNGNLHVHKNDIKKMKRHKTVMRKIVAHKKCRAKTHRKYLTQAGRGGFLPYVCKAFLNDIRGVDFSEQ